MLGVLSEVGESNKTSLALKTGLNYNTCLRYVELLRVLGWAHVPDVISSKQVIGITSLGRQMEVRLGRYLLSSKVVESNADSIVELGSQLSEKFNLNPENQQPKLKLNLPSDQRFELEGQSQKGSEPERNRQMKIMLVDDEEDVLFTFQAILTNVGYKVDAFVRSQSAVQKFASSGPSYYDLLVIDIRMPEVNGIQLYRRIKAIDPDAKVLIVTSLDAANELLSVFPEITSEHIIRKPIDKRTLINKVNMIVQGA